MSLSNKSTGVARIFTGAHSIGRVSYLIYVSMRHYVLTTSGDIVLCFHTAVCLLLICQLRNGVFNLLLGELYPGENEVIP